MSVTSCNDFLTIYPTTQIVEENFWEDKSDLESVVNACYSRMTREDMMQNYMVYGEARSDNFVPREEGTDGLHNMMNANLLPTDGYNWEAFYNAINWCSKVLEHGDLIIQRDQSFTLGDWKPIKAEMTALRALNYFYLVRTWREVPLVLKAYNDDSENFLVPQSSQEAVLDTMINELELVKDDAMQKYTSTTNTKGRITRKAIYSLLADMYLWRAAKNESADSVAVYGDQSAKDYQRCIECCDYVIDQTKAEKLEEQKQTLADMGSTSIPDPIKDEDLLIKNKSASTSGNVTVISSGAYQSIFGDKNSDESIFELQFEGSSNINNTAISAYYGYNTSGTLVGALVCSPIFQDVSSSVDGNEYAYYKTDMRRWENVHYEDQAQVNYPMAKYIYKDVRQSKTDDNTKIDKTNINYDRRLTNNMDANWIIYRMSDIFLMKAEAISRLYPTDATQIANGFHYVSVVSKRSNPDGVTKGDTIKLSSITTGNQLTALVLRERQRELIGEGKRWFDLVRKAQREGSTSGMLDLLVRKYDTNAKAIRTKLATMNALFCPVAETEMKKNSLLRQNPVWEKEETISKTK
jgi:hypothetical protein